MYQCGDCNKFFSTKGNLTKHINKENKENNNKKKDNSEIKEDIYKEFLDKKTKESQNHIHTQRLYENFVIWYKENIGEKNIPSNREFMKNLKIHFLVHKSIKVDDKVSTGVKNLELC